MYYTSLNYGPTGADTTYLTVFWLGILVVYLFVAYCLYRIAKRVKADNAWFAWVPILNSVLMLQIAKKPIWWIILLFIPLVNIVVSIMIMYHFVKALGKSGWWALLMIIPGVNLIAWGVLGFEE